ncbi:MAG TPA: pyridoxal-dependent decarboxylase [Mycobacteriales bacterium]|jgi:aromatic-L-amino-acid decarboxylase|nr:pyridoxal-dependent decarboxylase [Mycobacteriales bacterium]
MNAPRESFHMTPDEFRAHGRAVVDWIADYLEHVGDLPVASTVEPGAIRAALPAHPPEHGEPFEAMLRDVSDVVVPGLVHWQSPRFFGFFPCNGSGPAILGDLLSTGLGVQGMLWATSPAATEIETHVLDWLAELLALPERFRSTGSGGGVIQDSASSATLCALLAARERAGASYGRLTGYTSTQAHSSVEKAWRIAGLDPATLRQVPVDATYAMRPDALRDLLAADVAAGLTPAFVSATVGTTSSNAMDPLGPVGAAAREHGAWLHVDAAMSGTAALCEEFRWIHDGLDGADSYCVNPHKWMFTSFDCDAFYVADRAALTRALSIVPEYLRNAASESGAVVDYRDWQVPLGRRFRALKLWFVIRHYGAEGLRHHVREHVRLAHELAGWVGREPRLVLSVDAPLNLVCFRHARGDEATQRLLDGINASGRAYVTHTRLGGDLTIRVCVGATQTRREHVDDLRALITGLLDNERVTPRAAAG